MKKLILLIFALNFALAHGISYSVKESNAIVLSANFSQNIPVSFGEVKIYFEDSALAMIKGQTDENGKFAFLPPKAGNYRAEITGNSDHGEHKIEFNIEINSNFGVSKYDELAFARYQGILSVLGLIFGLFGVIVIIKNRSNFKKNQ